MRPLGELDLLRLWELGSARHPIDRALLLCGWARADLEASRLADLPLGVVNESLIRLRGATFGDRIDLVGDCPGCHERMEVRLDAAALLGTADAADARAEVEIAGWRFRAPTSRDLAAAADAGDAAAAALVLLERCCVVRPPGVPRDRQRLLDEASDALAAIDPLADVELSVSCEACSRTWTTAFEIASVLWDEIAESARAVLREVHLLAEAYGWSEPEILALTPHRRRSYLGMVGA
jgi:hypothetical protein